MNAQFSQGIIIIIIIIERVLLKCRKVEKNFKNTVHQWTLQKNCTAEIQYRVS